jgi:phage portal protein BeeE
MNLFDRLRNAYHALTLSTRSAQDYRRVTVRPSDRMGGSFGRRGDASTIIGNYQGYLAICARIIANAASDVELRLYVTQEEATRRARCREFRHERQRRLTTKETDFAKRASQYAAESHGDIIEVRDSRYDRFLRTPCAPELMTANQFSRFIDLCLLLPGNGYIYMPSDEGVYMALPLLPQHVGIVADENADGLIREYRYGRDLGRSLAIPAEEVVHYRYDPDFTPYFGRSPAFDVITHVQTQLKADLAEYSKWDNYARPDYVAKIGENVPAPVAKMIEERLKMEFGGPTNNGQLLVGQGLEIQTLTFNSKDMEYVAGSDYNKNIIANSYEVPLSVLNRDSANRASAESGDYALYRGPVMALRARRADQDTALVLPRLGYEPGDAFVLFPNPVPEDVAAQRAADRMDYMGGALTIEEYRAKYQIGGDTEPGNIEEAGILRINGMPVGQAEQMQAAGGGFGLPMSLAPEPEQPDQPEPVDGFNIEDPLTTPKDAPVSKVEDAGLNGAQMDKLISIAEKVQLGQLPLAAGAAIARLSFPGIDQALIDNVFNALTEGGTAPIEATEDPQPTEQASRAAEDVNLTPTDGMREEAQRGLDWRAEYGRGGTEVAVARARSILNGDLSADTVKVMVGWFARHEVDKQGEGWSPGEDGYPSAGRIAWALWGGDAGQSWANDKAAQLENRAAPEPTHTRDDDRAPNLEDASQRIDRVFAAFADDIERLYTEALASGINSDGTLKPEFDAALGDILDLRIPEIWRISADEVGNNFDADLTQFAPPPEVVAQYKASTIKTLGETLQGDVERAIGRGLEQGKTQAQVVADIMEFAPEDYPKFAAERIARTETAYALEAGSVEAMAEIGIEEKEFELSVGACPVCVAYRDWLSLQDRLIVPMREPFARGGQDFPTPDGTHTLYRDNNGSGVHPNCRCGYKAVIDDGTRKSPGEWLNRAKNEYLGGCNHAHEP